MMSWSLSSLSRQRRLPWPGILGCPGRFACGVCGSLPIRGAWCDLGMGYMPRLGRCLVEKALTGRRAQVLAVLDQPRTAAEIGALTGLDRRALYATHALMREGRIVHCGPSHFLRADLVGQFEPRKRLPWPRPPTEAGTILRERIMALLAEPRGADEIARLLSVKRDQANYMLRRLIREGRVLRAVRDGYRERYIYRCATPE